MKKVILFVVLGLAAGIVAMAVHDNRIIKQQTPVHITARIRAIYNPAPQDYSSGSSERVVSGLKVSAIDERENKILDEISVALYKKLWFASWESHGHASVDNIYLVSSTRILRSGSLISITSLHEGDQIAIDGNYMLDQGGVIVAEQIVVQ